MWKIYDLITNLPGATIDVAPKNRFLIGCVDSAEHKKIGKKKEHFWPIVSPFVLVGWLKI